MYVVNIVPMLEWLIRGALGRDPNKIDSDPKKSKIFAEDSKAEGIQSGNKRHYEDETATQHQTEDEIKQADNLNKFVEIIPTTLPREMTKTKLKEIFKNLTLEEQEKVLNDARQFIYQNTKRLSYFDEKTGKYKIYNNKEVKTARNIQFNEDGTTTFENDNGQWVVDEDGVSQHNSEEKDTEKNPPISPEGGKSSNIKFEQVQSEIQKLREILLNSNIPQGTKNIIEKTTDDKLEQVIKQRIGKTKNYNTIFGNDLLKYNDDGSISFVLNDKTIPVLALFIGKNISTLYNNNIDLIDSIKANINVDLLENYIQQILKEDNNGNCTYKW